METKRDYIFNWIDYLDRSRYWTKRSFSSQEEIDEYIKNKRKWSELEDYELAPWELEKQLEHES